MSGYANAKRRQIQKFIKWLTLNKPITVEEGKRHTIITYIHNGESTPVPARHSKVNKFLVAAMVKWLIEYKICTQEECDKFLK